MQDYDSVASSAAGAPSRGHGWSAAILAMPRIVQGAFFFVIAKDWLFSAQHTFPYGSLLVLTLLFALVLRVPSRAPDTNRCVMAAAILAMVVQPFGSPWPILVLLAFPCGHMLSGEGRELWLTWTVIGALALLSLFGGPGGQAVGIAGVVACAIVQRRWPVLAQGATSMAVVIWTISLWPAATGLPTDYWVGTGLSANPQQAALSVAIPQELGGFASHLTMVSLWLVGLAALVATRNPQLPLANRLSLAGAVGTLTGLTWLGRESSPMLSTASLAGSVVLACALVAMHSAIGSDPIKRTASPHQGRKRRRVVATVAMAVTVALATGWVWAFALVGHVLDRPRADDFVPASEVSPAFLDATVAMEDGHFYHHHGFDVAALHRALRIDLREGKVVQGGSTISEQLAKNMFLTDDRSFWRKLLEAFLVVELERRLTKVEILERYVNLIDYGSDSRGIGQGSQVYFHHKPDSLTLAESAVLVGVVPSPPHGELDWQSLDTNRRKALDRIAHFFPERYSDADREAAKATPIRQLVYPFKNAWDRYAVESVPPVWHGVTQYSDLAPEHPAGITGVFPLLKERFGQFLAEAHEHLGLIGVSNIGVYNDRAQRGSSTVLSAHAYGQAIDVSGFQFADGNDVRVEHHDDPRAAKKLLVIERLLRKHFDIVVDWREDPQGHGTHFHAEVRGSRNFPMRHP